MAINSKDIETLWQRYSAVSNGIKVEHHRLNYGELVCFINKLQGYARRI